MANPKLNDIGRAVGVVADEGKVEINDTLYEATTSSTPIKNGEEVTVTGWKFVNGELVVFVRRPGDHAPSKHHEETTTQTSDSKKPVQRSAETTAVAELKTQLKRLRIKQGILEDEIDVVRSRLGMVIGVLIGLAISFLPFGLAFVTEKIGGIATIHVYLAGFEVFSESGSMLYASILKSAVSLMYCGLFAIIGGVIGSNVARR